MSRLMALLAVLGGVVAARAVDGYSNDFSTLNNFTVRPPLVNPRVDNSVPGNPCVKYDAPTGATGYLMADLFDPSGAPEPIDVSNGLITLRWKIDYTGVGAPPTGDPIGLWLRVYSGTFSGGQWTYVARASWSFTAYVNMGWAEATRCVNVPDEVIGGTFDPTHVYKFRFDVVYWDPKYSPCTIALDQFTVTQSDNLGPTAIATANPPFPVCGQLVTLDASTSFDPDGSIVRYVWKEGTTVLYDGPLPTFVVQPLCQETTTYTLVVYDAVCAWDDATVDVTVGDYGATQFSFTTYTAPANGDGFTNSIASAGTYIYWLKGNGEFRRSANGTTWQTLPNPPLDAINNQCSGHLAYAPAWGTQGSLLTLRRVNPDPNYQDGLARYDIASGVWTMHGGSKFGNTGYVVVGNYLFSNAHAAMDNQGGNFCRINLLDPNAPYCGRSAINPSLLGQDPAWMSRVVQLTVLNGMIYGIKNDWTVNRGTGDRFYRFDPDDWANNWFVGPNWDDWEPSPPVHTPAEDLGETPREPGYGSGLCALPAGWKGVIGPEGGIFMLFGRTNANHEGWGGVTDRYGIWDAATGQWTLGILPAFSSSGSACCFHNGNVWIKQGCSNPSNPDADPTPTFWVTDQLIPPIEKPVADAGPDQGPMAPQVVTLDGTASYATAPGATIVSWRWTLGSTVIGTGPTPQVILPDGETSNVSLVVTDSNGVSSDPDSVSIALEACGSPAPGWFNDFTSTAGVTGPFPVYIQNIGGKSGVAMNISDAHGYYGFDVVPVCPFDASGGKITLTLRNGGTGLPPVVGWWLRLWTANGGYRGYAFGVAGDGQWATQEVCLDDHHPNEWNENFDPTQITGFRIESVVWGGTADYTMGLADATFTRATTFPTASAGPDQTVPGQCGQLSNVQLNGSGSTGATTYEWLEADVVIATGPTPVVQLPPGVHFITLEVADAGGCARDTDEVVITVTGAQPMPVELALDEQIDYGLGEVITADAGIFYLAWADPETGQDWPYTRAYLTGGDWYYGPFVNLQNACYGVLDLSGPNMGLRFSARYFQDADYWNPDPNYPDPYEDAPIGIWLRDTAGKRGWTGWLYGPDMRTDPLKYPAWKTIEVPIAIDPNPDFTDADFDLSRVWRIEFFGTDWGGLGGDFVDLKDLWIGETAPPACIGDTNCDGFITFGDINPFVSGLTGGPLCNPANFDINQNGTIGFDDINPFVAYLTGHQGEACP